MIIAILFYSGFDLLKLISKIEVIAYSLSIENIWTWEIWFNSNNSSEENVLDRDQMIGAHFIGLLTMDIRTASQSIGS